MAKLSGPFGFKGKLSDISAYTMKGCDGTVLRMGWGPSKEDIQTKDNYVNTRRNNAEFGGLSKTGSYIKGLFDSIETVLDYNIQATLTGLLKQMQVEDKESPWGNRNVLISKKPYLLEGLTLNKRNLFDAVIPSPFHIEMDKEAGKALVRTPELMPSINFFPPPTFSVCRISAVLSFLPDFYYAIPRYKPLHTAPQWSPSKASSEWFRAREGCPSTELSLALSGTLPKEGFTLLVAICIEAGTPSPGAVTPLKYNGCGKIAMVR
jgi:hypothetical protein